MNLPAAADCLYIHDLAVRQAHHGTGIATRLVQALLTLATELRLSRLALVAVQDSEPFWERWGFERKEPLVYADSVPATHMVLTREIS